MGIDWGALDAELAGVPGAVPKGHRERRAPKQLQRKTRINPINRERVAAQKQVTDGPQADACRIMGVCCACGKDRPTEPHHEPPVSLGGTVNDTVPMCRPCHDEREGTTARAFWKRLQLDPEDVKLAVRDWLAAGCPKHAKPFGCAEEGGVDA